MYLFMSMYKYTVIWYISNVIICWLQYINVAMYTNATKHKQRKWIYVPLYIHTHKRIYIYSHVYTKRKRTHTHTIFVANFDRRYEILRNVTMFVHMCASHIYTNKHTSTQTIVVSFQEIFMPKKKSFTNFLSILCKHIIAWKFIL